MVDEMDIQRRIEENNIKNRKRTNLNPDDDDLSEDESVKKAFSKIR